MFIEGFSPEIEDYVVKHIIAPEFTRPRMDLENTTDDLTQSRIESTDMGGEMVGRVICSCFGVLAHLHYTRLTL